MRASPEQCRQAQSSAGKQGVCAFLFAKRHEIGIVPLNRVASTADDWIRGGIVRCEPPHRLVRVWVCVLVTFASLATGCASWTERSTERDAIEKQLPVKKSRRSFVLETRFVHARIDPAQPDQFQSLWQWTDETVLPSETRQLLMDNGIRVARVAERDRFESKLSELSHDADEDELDELLKSAAVASDHTQGKSRIPMRLGKRYELPVRLPVHGVVTPIIKWEDQLVGKTVKEPQYLFALTGIQGDGTKAIDIQLVPEIQHGDMTSRWTGRESAMRIETRRQSWPLLPLSIVLEAEENATFVIGQTQPQRGLGQHMFRGEDSNRVEQQVLLLLTVTDVPDPVL